MLFALTIVCLAVCGTVWGILVPVPKGTCELDFDGGLCAAYIPVWTYNAAIGGCIKAVYGGCGGNANRFPTPELCGILCFPENICNIPFDAGCCKASIPVWTHNSSTGVCEIATYGGCGGNSNRFNTQEECSSYCLPECKTDLCELQFDIGPCDAYKEVYTFSSTLNACVQAVYGGCGGNENRFDTKEGCRQRCKK